MKRGKRNLRPEEQELWARVTETAIPMTVRAKAKLADKPIKTKVPDPVSPRSIKSFKIGERVYHAKFGEGQVLQFEGGGASARIQVNFEWEGTKWLVVAYAKLQSMDDNDDF